MVITDLETYVVGNPWKTWVFVRLLTDENIYGVGEATLGQMSRAVEGAIEDIKPWVIGVDPFDMEWMVSRLSRELFADGGQIKMCAISAIEMACWDIIGKKVGLPVYKLIGGQCHQRLRAYANGWYRCERQPEAFAERALRVVQRGYSALKFDPFGAAWRFLSPREEDLSLDIVRQVRAAVGPHVDLMIEAHQRFGVAQAIRLARRLEEFHPAWFEEPVPHHDPHAAVAVARATSIPIATGENLSSKQALADLLRHDAIHIVQLEPSHIGGILAARKLADMVDAHYGVIAPHSAAGAIATMACVHIDAATPNFYIQEYFHDFSANDWEKTLFKTPARCVDGYIELPTAPGLGIDLDVGVARAHPPGGRTNMNLWTEGWEMRGDKSTSPVEPVKMERP